MVLTVVPNPPSVPKVVEASTFCCVENHLSGVMHGKKANTRLKRDYIFDEQRCFADTETGLIYDRWKVKE